MTVWPATAALVLVLAVAGVRLLLRWGTRWGATPDECARRMPGDGWLDDGPRARVAMTRAISIRAEPSAVWPWIAQMGRGAGWYSFDWLDNGARSSARHIVSWIPDPQPGDATPIGYLRHLEPGRAAAWWVKGTKFAGARVRLIVDIRLEPQARESRLVIRMSADAAGPAGRVALLVFQFIDTIMASRQLLGIRERVERYASRTVDPDNPETGERDQYQLYEVIYASGEKAGVRGRELASRWRRTAIEDGVLPDQVL